MTSLWTTTYRLLFPECKCLLFFFQVSYVMAIVLLLSDTSAALCCKHHPHNYRHIDARRFSEGMKMQTLRKVNHFEKSTIYPCTLKQNPAPCRNFLPRMFGYRLFINFYLSIKHTVFLNLSFVHFCRYSLRNHFSWTIRQSLWFRLCTITTIQKSNHLQHMCSRFRIFSTDIR